jgi:hypothetical protein
MCLEERGQEVARLRERLVQCEEARAAEVKFANGETAKLMEELVKRVEERLAVVGSHGARFRHNG